MWFEILGSIRSVEVIASGRGVKVRRRLQRHYGAGRWRKMKGITAVRDDTGSIYEAEVHWYEAHGIGRREFKLKRKLG
jgi:hypothetical protein